MSWNDKASNGAGRGADDESLGREWRIGVDIGGTFTDLVAIAETGALRIAKVPSTPDRPEQAVLDGLDALAAAAGETVAGLLAGCRLFVHGSTVATNTVLEHKGARVGLIATEGFRDSLEIRRGIRPDPWRHREPYPPVLVPRHRRLPVGGRIGASGEELEPLDREALDRQIERLLAEDAEVVAVSLFNSIFADGQERAAAAAVREAGLPVFVSSEIAPVLGEYERTSTVALNAYVGPRTARYVSELSDALAARGLAVPMLLTQNNGGMITPAQVAARPASLLLSGPAAAVGALRHHCDTIGSDNLISMEIGGTSCDVLVMADGEVALTDALDIGGHFLAMPSVDIHTIGAGGGTIARVDAGGMLAVGPEGAGAMPGPAAYGRGGQEATATDAQLVLGRLAPGPYAGGAVSLDADLAEAAIRRCIAEPLGIGVEAAAQGMIRLLEQKLLHALEHLSVEQGHDPRRFTLVAGGGAGALHGAAVARRLGCRRVYVPRLAGAFCAFGMLHSDIRHDTSRVHISPLDSADGAAIASRLAEMRAELAAALAEAGFAEPVWQYGCDLRYQGQQWDVTVPLGASFDLARLREGFEQRHRQLFGHVQPRGTIEITRLRLAGVGPVAGAAPAGPAPAQGDPVARSHRPVWIDAARGRCMAPIYEGADLAPGHAIAGPAIVNEQTTTVLVGAGDRLEVDAHGNYAITLDADAAEDKR
ncbi:hydantoinase/oxoprolinase family protein [Paralimibaculum aggregatum]|uniref:Hydantoinase/oxoprolinase family protein n=1 Tax=Paralimibaculum aggregatum TaxID=3036245 RepID=A0ABQ6LFK9_9RHOB|nr:hydantoinase/oxoprolinase family protein [Limibaculum sp. NKW23]GMG82113.1 hydantoinase/oxoprolinase family protein [Limibaculum sp. NKW23]